MAKKHWIYIKRGLSEDPKHRAAMGECIWLFMHIIDRADWETGIAFDWKDEAEAADMSMPLRTLREQRRKLADLGYITCVQKQRKQDVIIRQWINPRDYSGGIVNPKGGSGMEPSENEGNTHDDNHGYTHGSTQDVTPTSNSKSKSSSVGGLSEKELGQANAQVDAMIANSKKVKYQNRDKMPEPYLMFADLYNELTGQEPTKRSIMEWMSTFEDWKAEGLQPEHIRAAWNHANRDGGFPVGRPSALTNTAVAMKSKMLQAHGSAPKINEAAVEETRRMLEEKEKNYTTRPTHLPSPADIKAKLQQAAEQRGIRK
jgi:hypothetical protein